MPHRPPPRGEREVPAVGLRRLPNRRAWPAIAAAAAVVAQLYRELVNNGVRYFTSERDGPDVDPSVLARRPANLTDTRAYVYADPKYDGNDNLLGGLRKIAGPVDVSGGWFDAGGGYEKFG